MFFKMFVDVVACRVKMLVGGGLGVTVFGPLLVSVTLVVVFLLVFRISCSACRDKTGCLSCFLAPTAITLTMPLCRRVRPLGGG